MKRRDLLTGAAALTAYAALEGSAAAFGLGRLGAGFGRLGSPLGGAGNGPSSYTGQVATASAFPDNNSSATNKNTMSRSSHIAMDNISSVQVAFANWLVNGVGAEQNAGGTSQLIASIEYPAGTFSQLLFSGSSTPTMADGATLLSDSLTISIPSGAQFWVRIWFQGTTIGLFKTLRNTAAGEAMAFAASGLANQTMSGTVTDGGFNGIYRPVAIVAKTKKPAIFIAGDSRANGFNDTYSGTSTLIGDITRSIGTSFGFINGGTNAAQLANWLGGNGAKRLALANAYCSHVINELGINDFSLGGLTAAQLQAEQTSFAALLSGQPLFLMTLEPYTSSSDGWTTVPGQSVLQPQRITYNDWVRTSPAVATGGWFEIANVVESSVDSGKWSAPGWTADGIHETQSAYIAIVTANAIPASAFHRP